MLQALIESLFEFGWRALGEPFRTRSRASPVLAALGLLCLGGGVGLLFAWLIPTRLVSVGRVPGASLVLSPIVAGTMMEYYGRWRARRGVSPSFATTFWGGALFAFGMASARFLLVRGT